MDRLSQYINKSITDSVAVKNAILNDQALLQKIEDVALLCVNAFKSGNKVILAGNGGSAADAQHIAAEFVSRFEFDRPGLPSIALTTDTSIITAISNDYGYENLFKRQLLANARAGDLFIGITTSGNSNNIIAAMNVCNELEVVPIGLAGKEGKIHEVTEVCLGVPSTSTPRIQESHILIGHIICGVVENKIFGDSK